MENIMKLQRHAIIKILAFFVLSSISALACASAQELVEPLAIITHQDTNELTQDEVARIFLAEQQFWPDNSRITLLIRAPVSPERTFGLRQIYQMSEKEFRKYWITKMFKAEVASAPKVMYSLSMAINLVTAIPGAITFVPFSQVPVNAKVLKVNGKFPDDKDYEYRL
jgi:ABC-type phosphate transport system substrate-binding protein